MPTENYKVYSDNLMVSFDSEVYHLYKEHKYLDITVKYGKKRSLRANALYWDWMQALSERFSAKGQYSKEEMHDLMRHNFLGYEDRMIGNTLISQQLKSTTDLDSGEMFHYMEKIDAWAADHGCLLPRPSDGEYEKWAKQS